jgi:hypothetical protein
MLGIFKKLFSATPAQLADSETAIYKAAPYKVETPGTVAVQATQAVVESIAPANKTAKPKTEKKPVAKAKTARKPRAPKA